MKDYIIDWKAQEFEFDGEKVTAELFPMKRGVSILLTEALGSEQDGQIKIVGTLNEIAKVVEPHIDDLVRNIKGFKINGKDPEIKELLNYSEFLPLVSDIIAKLLSMSSLDEAEIRD